MHCEVIHFRKPSDLRETRGAQNYLTPRSCSASLGHLFVFLTAKHVMPVLVQQAYKRSDKGVSHICLTVAVYWLGLLFFILF